MRLYLVGINSLHALADALRKRDLSYQVITDPTMTGEIACARRRAGCVLCYVPQSYDNKTDCDHLLAVWGKDGRFSLVQVGNILNLDGAHVLLAVPNTMVWRLMGSYVSWRVLRRRIA